jgi:hypothetical protein
MWDPRKSYDDLEHSIFEKNAYMWDTTEFYDGFEQIVFKIMLTCGIDVSLWRFSELMASQNSMEQGTPGYIVNCNDENFCR